MHKFMHPSAVGCYAHAGLSDIALGMLDTMPAF